MTRYGTMALSAGRDALRGALLAGAALTFAALIAGSPAISAGVQPGKTEHTPSGHAYSPDDTRVPSNGTRRKAIEDFADIRETEIYESQRKRREFQDLFDNFRSLDYSSPSTNY